MDGLRCLAMMAFSMAGWQRSRASVAPFGGKMWTSK
jgi:hypothetical protein